MIFIMRLYIASLLIVVVPLFCPAQTVNLMDSSWHGNITPCHLSIPLAKSDRECWNYSLERWSEKLDADVNNRASIKIVLDDDKHVDEAVKVLSCDNGWKASCSGEPIKETK